jgi:hypothetical protein
MNRIFLTVMAMCLSAGLTFGQVEGQAFPQLTAETIDDLEVSLPDDVKGKYSLIGMAYSKKSEDDLNTWFSPVYNKFIREATGLFSSFQYDVNVYFVPMFTGVNAAATGTAKKKVSKNLDERLLPYILFYKGSLKPYKDALEFEKKDVPYLFVLDEEGTIIYATSGAYSDQKMTDIEEVLEE